MAETNENEKSDKILRLANEIIRDCAEKPSLGRLNIADLAKRNAVSRSWIYKNFGSSNLKIVLTAIDVLAPFITQPLRPMQVWRSNDMSDWLKVFGESLITTLLQVERFPYLFKFYIQTRLEKSELAERLAHHELQFARQVVRLQLQEHIDTGFRSSQLLAEYLVAVRIGLIFKWLTTEGKSIETQTLEIQEALSALADRLRAASIRS